MHKTIKKFVQYELRNYHYYKTTLYELNIHKLLTYKQQLWLTLTVQGIEIALAGLSPELNQYVRLRYFQKNYYTSDGLAMQLNISDRTLRKWDQMVIHAVAQQMGVLNTVQHDA